MICEVRQNISARWYSFDTRNASMVLSGSCDTLGMGGNFMRASFTSSGISEEAWASRVWFCHKCFTMWDSSDEIDQSSFQAYAVAVGISMKVDSNAAEVG
jgi:hypothetical protein